LRARTSWRCGERRRDERAEALALLKPPAGRKHVTAEATIVEQGKAIKVAITANRDSFFGNLVPPGGFTTRAEATAVGMSRTPLCILVDGQTGQDKAANLLDSSKIKAEGCLVHSNRDIAAEGASKIEAGACNRWATPSGTSAPKRKSALSRSPIRSKGRISAIRSAALI
jgi:hypothetical protein